MEKGGWIKKEHRVHATADCGEKKKRQIAGKGFPLIAVCKADLISLAAAEELRETERLIDHFLNERSCRN